MKKFIFALVVVALLATTQNANASTKTYHIVKSSKVKIARYGYTYHRLSTIKCPYFGCRRTFTHN